jgi:tetratricopeptide (TPR) repeat protein
MVKVKRKPTPASNPMQPAETSFGRAERFIEENQKYFLYGLAGILIIVFGIIGYVKFIRNPLIESAWEESYKAEYYFEIDSFRLALYGDGFFPGFLDIIDDYGRTPMGNASRYYAGVCFMRLGEYEEAITMLNKFKSKDPMVAAMALSLIGDANFETGDPDEAVKYYLKAVEHADNDFLSPLFLMKAAASFEEMGEYEKALETYQRIETEYYGSSEQVNLEKYLKRAELLSASI